MKRTLLLLACLGICILSFSEQGTTKWSAKIETQKVFIENKGQFDLMSGDNDSKILFGTDGGSNVIFFTRSGLTYYMEKRPSEKEDELEERGVSKQLIEKLEKYRKEEQERKNGPAHELPDGAEAVHMEWVGANPDVEIVAGDKTANYFNYHLAHSSVSNASAYKKITYKNLYPNIDVVYTFHEGEGIEYTLLAHAGADLTKVKMRYAGTPKISLSPKGELHVQTMFGDVIDRAPTTYVGSGHTEIPSKFILNGNEVTFDLGMYNHNSEVMIDPWTTTPTLPRSNRAYYVKTDSSGNAYVYGGDTPFTLEKYNSSGSLQWTYSTTWDTSSDWFGTLIVDRAGNSYITNGTGGTLAKINPAGGEVWSNTNTTILGVEYWTMDFNCDQTQLVIGGMSGLTGYIFNMNLASGAVLNNKQVAKTYLDTTWIPILHIPFAVADPNEIRSLCFSPNGNFYFLTPDTLGSISPSFTFNYEIPSSFRWPYYLPYSEGGTGQGQNSIRATVNYIYTTDGEVLQKRNIGNGAIIDSVNIPNSTYQMNSGIAIDTCGNVYVGSQNAVYKYDANLTFISSASTPAAVYDVSIGVNGDVLACGQGFAVALAMNACPQVKPICDIVLNASLTQTNPACAGLCTGTATATPGNGTGPYHYTWSNSATAQTITGLCAGSYTVTITDQSNGNTATATTNISQPVALSASATPTAATCGASNGAATVSVSNGSGTFNYSWSNGATTQSVSNLPPATYTVTATNTNGCTATASATIITSGSISASTSTTNATCGASNGTATVSPSGATSYTYHWGNGNTTATITGIGSGTYDVTVTSGSCSATASALVSSSNNLTLTPTGGNTTCGNSNGSASVTITSGTGPYSYTWSNGSTTSAISNLASGTYGVTVSASGGCTGTASAVVAGSTNVAISSTTSAAGCAVGGSATVNVTAGSGPFSYVWSNGATSATVHSLSAGNYSVTVTGAAGCSASTTATVAPSDSSVTLADTTTASSCRTPNGAASITVLTGSGPYIYAWSNGSTANTIFNVAAGPYVVTVTGASGCSATAGVTVPTNGTVTVTTTTTNTSCGNNNGSAYAVIGGNLLSAYTWSNGATTDTISNLASGTYDVTVVSAGGCSVTATAVVNPSGGTFNLTPPGAICMGDTAQICAPSGYVSYHWNNGSTAQCINTTQAGNYYVTVVDNGNCTATSNHVTLTVNAPSGVSITEHGDTLTSTGAITYQWYYNNTAISGATAGTYLATQDGNYYVLVTDGNGCKDTSNTELVKGILGINQVEPANNIKIYPNPLASGNWHLDVSGEFIGASCEFYDAAGRLVYKTEIRNLQSEFELLVAQGVYLMRINSAQKSYTFKLIKL